MRKPEQKMWDRIKGTFYEKAKDVCRIETGSTAQGVPDLYVLMEGFAMWVELKVGERVGDVLIADVRQAQAVWALTHESRHGPACHLLVYEPTEKVYYHTKDAYTIKWMLGGPVPLNQFSRASDVSTLFELWTKP